MRVTSGARLPRFSQFQHWKFHILATLSVLGRLEWLVTLQSKQTVRDCTSISSSNWDLYGITSLITFINDEQFIGPKYSPQEKPRVSYQTKMDDEGIKPIAIYK